MNKTMKDLEAFDEMFDAENHPVYVQHLIRVKRFHLEKQIELLEDVKKIIRGKMSVGMFAGGQIQRDAEARNNGLTDVYIAVDSKLTELREALKNL